MARRPRAAEKEQETELLTALRFIEVAQHADGVPYQTHCWFAQGYVNAFDGILAAGFPYAGGVLGCPHTKKLIAALSKMRGATSLTMLDTHQLSISSAKFKAAIPCLEPIEIERVICDPPAYALTDDFKRAAELAGLFVKEGAPALIAASVITQDFSLVGTNTAALIEAYHGCHMPAGLMIPKAFITAMLKVDSPLTHFGFSEQSFTVHFENGGWLRTQLYVETPPKLASVFAAMSEHKAVDIPADLKPGLDAVLPHVADNSRVYLHENTVRTNLTDNIGAVYTCEGLPFSVAVNGPFLRSMLGIFELADFTTQRDKIVFLSKENKARGLLMQMVKT